MAKTWNINAIYMDGPSLAGSATVWIGPSADDQNTALGPTYQDDPTDVGPDIWRLRDYPGPVNMHLGFTGAYPSGSPFKEIILFQIDIVSTWSVVDNPGEIIDLMPLVPTKFHGSPTMQDLVFTMSNALAGWMAQTRGLADLANADLCPGSLLQYLAGNIGVTYEEGLAPSVIRQIIKDAPYLYQYKGSYQGNPYLQDGDYITVRELWAADDAAYTAGTFQEADWQATDGGIGSVTLPAGISAGSYKVPHVNVYVRLSEQKIVATVPYLLIGDDDMFNELFKLLPFKWIFEKVRSVIMFPHWRLYVQGQIGVQGVEVIGTDHVRTTWLGDSDGSYLLSSLTDASGISTTLTGTATASGVSVESHSDHWEMSIILSAATTLTGVKFTYSAHDLIQMTFPAITMSGTTPVKVSVVLPKPLQAVMQGTFSITTPAGTPVTSGITTLTWASSAISGERQSSLGEHLHLQYGLGLDGTPTVLDYPVGEGITVVGDGVAGYDITVPVTETPGFPFDALTMNWFFSLPAGQDPQTHPQYTLLIPRTTVSSDYHVTLKTHISMS